MIIPQNDFQPAPGTVERRRFRRFHLAIAVELRPENSVAPIRGQTSDISAGGCYVEMDFTLTPGTRLDVVLWLGERKLQTKALVISSHPQFGNGIKFTALDPGQQRELENFLVSMFAEHH